MFITAFLLFFVVVLLIFFGGSDEFHFSKFGRKSFANNKNRNVKPEAVIKLLII